MNILMDIKIYLAIRRFGKKRSYLAGTNECIHVSREINSYNNLVYDIDWVLSDARHGVSSEDYILPSHHNVRCCRNELLDILQNIDEEIEKDVATMEQFISNKNSIH